MLIHQLCTNKQLKWELLSSFLYSTEDEFSKSAAVSWLSIPDNKVHGANMRPAWVLSAPDGPHGAPMNLAIRVY